MVMFATIAYCMFINICTGAVATRPSCCNDVLQYHILQYHILLRRAFGLNGPD